MHKRAKPTGWIFCGRLPRRAAAGSISTLSDRIMAAFSTPDSAAGAAASMRAAIEALPAVAAAKLGVRIGFHTGGMSGTKGETAALLGTSFRAFSRNLEAIPLAASASVTHFRHFSAPRGQ